MDRRQSLKRNRSCPANTVPRRAYTRKNGRSVKSACIGGRKDICREGEIPRVAHSRIIVEGGVKKSVHIPASCVRRQSLIRPLHKGDLKKYGYSYKATEEKRRNALVKAVNAYGALTTYHKLDAIAKLTETQHPQLSHVFSRDRNWVRSEYSTNGVLHR
jgi:hypothetical protein